MMVSEDALSLAEHHKIFSTLSVVTIGLLPVTNLSTSEFLGMVEVCVNVTEGTLGTSVQVMITTVDTGSGN